MGRDVGLGVAFVAGLVSFLSPCVLPIVPVYLAYLTGTAYGELTQARNRRRILAHALAFIGGFSAVFIAMGASATYVGRLLLDHQRWIEVLGGLLLLVLGVWMTGLVGIGFLHRDLRVHLSEKPAGYAGSALVGAAFAAGWTPCVGPVLAGILVLASRSGSAAYGTLLLAVYSLGLAAPLLLCCLALERSLALIRRVGPALPSLEKATGAALALMGLLLASGWFSRLSSWALGYFRGQTRLLAGLGL